MIVNVEDEFDASGSSDNKAISSFLWDFGDGTSSTEVTPVKKYTDVGNYTVTLTVTDNEGAATTVEKTVEVKERETLGVLNVKVIDDTDKALSGAPVYFDLGAENHVVVYTNSSGIATMQLPAGTHLIGFYADGYLPVKKEVAVLANATRTVTLTTVEQEIVTGEFEITRMTFDEIVAAGIDVNDPANQNVYTATVRVYYGGSAPFTVSYIRNDDEIISSEIKDSNGRIITYVSHGGESRSFTPVYLGSAGGSDIVAILDIPAQASYLKEFFDVRLHIINNASSDFSLLQNEVVLNVPEGMTLMKNVASGYCTNNTVNVAEIKGQQTVTLAWVLRGDTSGEYNLSADFTGTLSDFNEIVTARFETNEPIKVYGLDGITFRILASDEIHNDTLYFNLEMENNRDIDINMPNLGMTDKIKNVTESVLHDNPDGDFTSDSYLLNIYVQSAGGSKQYIPIVYDANGEPQSPIDVLAPGQKLVYEYVSYNAINYDGVAYFLDATIQEFTGIAENIETGSFTRELYSFLDYSEKLDAILAGTDESVSAALDYIIDDANYYCINEAGKTNAAKAFRELYDLADLILNVDLSVFTRDEQKQVAEDLILSILTDGQVQKVADDLVATKYIKAVKKAVNNTKTGLINSNGDVDWESVFDNMEGDIKSLSKTMMQDGEKAFYESLRNKIMGYAQGVISEGAIGEIFGHDAKEFFGSFEYDKNYPIASSITSVALNGTTVFNDVLDALSETERDAYIFALLRLDSNVEYCNFILDAISDGLGSPFHADDALRLGIAALGVPATKFPDMEDIVRSVVFDFKQQVNNTCLSYQNQLTSFLAHFTDEFGQDVAKVAIKGFLKEALKGVTVFGLKPLEAGRIIFNLLENNLHFDSYYKQEDVLEIYTLLEQALSASFLEYAANNRSEKNDLYSMTMLKALCELRLGGEAQYKAFIRDYMDGKFLRLSELPEDKVMKIINKAMGTSYSNMDDWYDDVQYNIVSSRDILFNVEKTSMNIPRAPRVSLNYNTLQTNQSFSNEYEYCFADGVWKRCDGNPIEFTVKTVPGTLRVRVAAGDENLAGEITTVKIFARKDLSRLITVRFNGMYYEFNNLSDKYSYQVCFVNDPDDELDWTNAEVVGGASDPACIYGVGEYDYVAIRSMANYELQETFSNTLYRTVKKQQKLQIDIEGCGLVTQSNETGMYFVGDDIELTAVPNAENTFLGWYIDDVCVSTDVYYIVEMSDDLAVKAVFDGPSIRKIDIQKEPDKLAYSENEALDLTGLEIKVTYTDGSTVITSACTATVESNQVGERDVTVTIGRKSDKFTITISHNMSEWREYEHATCSEKGEKVKVCLVCGYAEYDTTQTIPHTEEVRNATDPTCTEVGYSGDVYCSVCDALLERGSSIKKLGHDYGEWTSVDGENHQRVCANDPSHIETAAHDWDRGTVTKEAACSGSGIKTYTCTDCGMTKTETIQATGHNYGKWTVTKAATCTEAGVEQRVCKNDDSHVETRKINAIGHNWSQWTVVSEPTCMDAGLEQRVCANDAGHVETRMIGKLEHVDADGDGICDDCHTDIGSSAPAEPESNCVCGQYHTGPFAGIIKFFHKIVYFFKNLFGKN